MKKTIIEDMATTVYVTATYGEGQRGSIRITRK
jgi:hypothetical protein